MKKKPKSYKRKLIPKPQKGTAFFRDGFRTYKGRQVGVYKVMPEDNMWVIARNYMIYYKNNQDYKHEEVVLMVNKMLLLNFKKQSDGSIKPDIAVRKRLYIPID